MEPTEITEEENLLKLGHPFPAEDLEWRVGRCGKSGRGVWASVLAYITARAVMDRLDAVVGPANWKDRYWREGTAVMCGLSIKVNGGWVEKVDGSEESDIEAVKGGISGALKRAAVKWGIGRYLYNLTDGYAQIVDDKTEGAHWGKTKENVEFSWLPPKLPAWALPPDYLPKVDRALADKTQIQQTAVKASIAPAGKQDVVKLPTLDKESLLASVAIAPSLDALKAAVRECSLAYDAKLLTDADRAEVLRLKEVRKKELQK